MRRLGPVLFVLLLLPVFALVLSVPVVHASVSVANEASTHVRPASTTTTLTPLSVTSGNVVVVGIITSSDTTVSSVSDSLGSPYAQAIQVVDNVVAQTVAIYYATLSTSGSDRVTATISAGTEFDVYVFEVSGVSASAVTTAQGANDGPTAGSDVSSTSTSFSSPAFLLAVIATDGRTATLSPPGSGFTAVAQPGGDGYSHPEYSTSGVSSPTTFPATLSEDDYWVEVAATFSAPATCTGTATGGATACAGTSAGVLSGFSAVSVGSVSPAPPSDLTFPYGLFSITVTGLLAGQTVTMTITLSNPMPAGAFQYWKFQSGAWTQFTSASLDSTRTIITLTLTANSVGQIDDPGGPGILTPLSPSFAVGGEMIPINQLQVLVPWLALIAALGTVSVWALLVGRRRETD